MVNRRKLIAIVTIVITGCLIMAWVDAIIRPDYSVKSFVKIILFTLMPIGYAIFDRQISFSYLFKFNRSSLKLAVSLGIGVYILILGSYFILSPYFDFSKVTAELQNNICVSWMVHMCANFAINTIGFILFGII